MVFFEKSDPVICVQCIGLFMWSQDKYIKALNFAANAHGSQQVPGKDYSYIVHCASVAAEIMSAIGRENRTDANLAVQCAILHDTIEDTETTYEIISSEFGSKVAIGVQALTKDKKLEKSRQLKDSLERILMQTKEIAMVKLADRITNLQEPPAFWNKEKRVSYLQEARLILATLRSSSNFLSERLERKITEYLQFIK